MIPVSRQNLERLSPLFEAYEWNYLPDAILEGSTGRALADDELAPQAAVLEVPDLPLSIPAGNPAHPLAKRYIEQLPPPWALSTFSEGWDELVQAVHGGNLATVPRYAFTSEKLDLSYLRDLRSALPAGYKLAPLDLALAEQVAGEGGEFAEDHMRNFRSLADFIERGFGYCALDGAEIACVASTFAVCSRGIEIQINTRAAHRGRGLATSIAAALLVRSLESGLDPNWDAATEISANLARKLGYTPQGTYVMTVVVP